jgi:hypothetical protein
LGDLERAIDIAAELGETPRKPVWLKPKKTLRDLLSSAVAGSFVSEVADRLEERIYGGSQYYLQHHF